MAKTRKAQQASAGGRSGVIIGKKNENNLDDWFDEARSPDTHPKNNEPSVDEGTRRRAATKTSRKTMVKTPKQQMSMNLPGVEAGDDNGDGGEADSTKVKNYAKKLRGKGGANTNFASPSDLSRVSTAPRSPHDKGENEREQIQTDVEDKSKEGNDTETENVLLTQEEIEGADSTRENDAIDTDNLEVASPEDAFPVNGDHDDEEYDGDDLGPPALPGDDSEEEDQEGGKASEIKAVDDNDSVGSDSGSEKNTSIGARANDYEDDDDKEGPGFNMVHDPETPKTVREDRAKKEKEKLRKESKKNKKLESECENDDEDGDDDSKYAPNVKKSKKQKKKKRNVVFSPKGIPIANRDYVTEPIGTLIESSPDPHGPRRSKRAKVKPLEFWRGEKLEFGAHNEDGYMGEVFGNMPVVTGIQRALPTPYKKRKQTNNNAGAKKGGRSHAGLSENGNAQHDEFDSKKLRRKYNFHDGEEAYLWDDVTDDTADQSKLISVLDS